MLPRENSESDLRGRQAAEVDTIAAISTPPGRGGIGIVRLSGPGAIALAERLVKLSGPLRQAQVRFGQIVDGDGAVLDEALVTAFFAPHSYTGEDLAEIAAHGSPVVLEAVLRAAVGGLGGQAEGRMAARLAAPGEFTQRAFLAGRLDLTQAEAVQDLIAAHTLDQARSAAQQLGGALSRRVAPAKETLLHLIALLEAGMDFASGELDDVDVVAPAQIAKAIAEAAMPLRALAATFQRGRLLREGASIALVGAPNAGKSSLFNRLLERERAIVTPVAGTTRDTVEEGLALAGIPLRLIDTAGLRELGDAGGGMDEAEQQGIVRTREALADADVVLLIHDATQRWGEQERRLAVSLEGRPHVRVENKVDLLGGGGMGEDGCIQTSALTGFGLEALRAALLRELGAGGAAADSGALNTLRQHKAVGEAVAGLDAAATANAGGQPHEIVLLDLHGALRALDSLTGTTTPEDILGRIFATFCIGK